MAPESTGMPQDARHKARAAPFGFTREISSVQMRVALCRLNRACRCDRPQCQVVVGVCPENPRSPRDLFLQGRVGGRSGTLRRHLGKPHDPAFHAMRPSTTSRRRWSRRGSRLILSPSHSQLSSSKMRQTHLCDSGTGGQVQRRRQDERTMKAAALIRPRSINFDPHFIRRPHFRLMEEKEPNKPVVPERRNHRVGGRVQVLGPILPLVDGAGSQQGAGA